jgi:hypothetical protein
VAAARRLTDVLTFLDDVTRDEAAAAAAALAEPDDDRYLRARAQATAHLTAGMPPVVDRWAVPGGRTEDTDPAAADQYHPRVVFAVVAGTAGATSAWHAYVSAMHSAAGASIDQVLSILDVDGRLLVVGRRAVDPFADHLEWEDAGGTPVELDRVAQVRIERLPLDPQHAQFLQQLAGT